VMSSNKKADGMISEMIAYCGLDCARASSFNAFSISLFSSLSEVRAAYVKNHQAVQPVSMLLLISRVDCAFSLVPQLDRISTAEAHLHLRNRPI